MFVYVCKYVCLFVYVCKKKKNVCMYVHMYVGMCACGRVSVRDMTFREKMQTMPIVMDKSSFPEVGS